VKTLDRLGPDEHHPLALANLAARAGE